jgi:hypothetical protein
MSEQDFIDRLDDRLNNILENGGGRLPTYRDYQILDSPEHSTAIIGRDNYGKRYMVTAKITSQVSATVDFSFR